jgi:hypothetical protein
MNVFLTPLFSRAAITALACGPCMRTSITGCLGDAECSAIYLVSADGEQYLQQTPTLHTSFGVLPPARWDQ